MTNWILIILGFTAICFVFIYFTVEMKKVIKQDINDFNNAQYPMDNQTNTDIKLYVPKIELHSLSESELTTYHNLDATLYGEALAQKILDKLILNKNKPSHGLYYSHKYYCGLGIFIVEEHMVLCEINDGYPLATLYEPELILTFAIKNDFIEWLANSSDKSMALYGRKFNNQTITKSRLEWYLEEDYSPVWNQYCEFVRNKMKASK